MRILVNKIYGIGREVQCDLQPGGLELSAKL